MTELVEKVIAQIKQLSDVQQDKIAKIILRELKSQGKEGLSSVWEQIDELGKD